MKNHYICSGEATSTYESNDKRNIDVFHFPSLFMTSKNLYRENIKCNAKIKIGSIYQHTKEKNTLNIFLHIRNLFFWNAKFCQYQENIEKMYKGYLSYMYTETHKSTKYLIWLKKVQ